MRVYEDMQARTGGVLYIGVVGPVRTGKSTFIKRFMETSVLPNIKNPYDKQRASDEMPQSAAGKTVMTTEPKFIPDEAVEITVGENASFLVKMVDCVGYIVPDALGIIENGEPRMVMTPWHGESIPFERAAEIGTQKVINEHSTVSVLVTTDGSFGEIPRESFVGAEKRIIGELKAINKPFAVVLNSAEPFSVETKELAAALESEYGAPVCPVNCLRLGAEDIKSVLERILLEFPITEIKVALPAFMNALPPTHALYKSVFETARACAESVCRAREIKTCFSHATENENIKRVNLDKINLGNGKAEVSIDLKDGLLYKIMGEMCSLEIDGEETLIRTLSRMSQIEKKYNKIAKALDDVNEYGYGVVMPEEGDLRLEEPEIVKQAGGYGVRLRASAPSIHMLKADIETEVSPIVGTEQQSEELVRFMLREFEENPNKIWETNMLGKSLSELVNEGLHTKLSHMPPDAAAKLSGTLKRVINEGSGGLICIIL